MQFESLALLGRGENLLLVLAQFDREVADGVLQGLAVLVVLGHAGEVRVGHFEVVAVDFVEADFQAADAGASDFVRLIAGHPILAFGGELAKFVEFGVVAFANHAAIFGREGHFVLEGAVEKFTQIDAEFEPRFE